MTAKAKKADTAELAAARGGFFEELVDVDGVKLRVAIRRGSGRPMLLFNGVGANLELMRSFIDAMDGTEVIVFDMPGIGGSPPLTIPRRFSGLAHLTVQLLDTLGYTRPVNVLGISWGGAMAQQFALQFPERTNRLILCATSAGAVALPASPRILRFMVTPRRYLSFSFLKQIAPELYGGLMRQRPELISRHAESIVKPSMRGYFYQLIAGLGWTSAYRLPRLQAPTLVMAGDDDPIMPLVNSRLLYWLIPKSTMHVMRGGGHLFLVLRAHESAGIIRRFLSERRYDGTDSQDY